MAIPMVAATSVNRIFPVCAAPDRAVVSPIPTKTHAVVRGTRIERGRVYPRIAKIVKSVLNSRRFVRPLPVEYRPRRARMRSDCVVPRRPPDDGRGAEGRLRRRLRRAALGSAWD